MSEILMTLKQAGWTEELINTFLVLSNEIPDTDVNSAIQIKANDINAQIDNRLTISNSLYVRK